jgi:hypothetical protein
MFAVQTQAQTGRLLGGSAVSLRRWVLTVSIIILVAACGDGDDEPAGAGAAATTAPPTTAPPTTVAAATTTQAGKTYSIRGMTITLRPEWTAEVDVDEGANVTTGRPCVHSKLLGNDLCPAFQVFGPDGIAHGYEEGPYKLAQPWHPGTDVSPCLTAPDDGLEGSQTLVKGGFAKVGTKTANYREWRVTCMANSGNKPVGTPYVQRIWYLPKSKILVVDEWSTRGLDDALADARW